MNHTFTEQEAIDYLQYLGYVVYRQPYTIDCSSYTGSQQQLIDTYLHLQNHPPFQSNPTAKMLGGTLDNPPPKPIPPNAHKIREGSVYENS
jgi:hypothetical protein